MPGKNLHWGSVGNWVGGWINPFDNTWYPFPELSPDYKLMMEEQLRLATSDK